MQHLPFLPHPQFYVPFEKTQCAFFPHAWLQLAFTRVWQNDWQLFELLAGPSENIEMP